MEGGLQGGKFNAFYVVEAVLEIFFVIDLILNLRTSYPDSNNEEIVDGKMIARNYIKTKGFVLDLLSALPIPEIALIIFGLNNHYIKLYYIIRITRVRKISRLSSFISTESYLTLFSFVKMFMLFAILVTNP